MVFHEKLRSRAEVPFLYIGREEKGSSLSEYSDPEYEYTVEHPILELIEYSFEEMTHFAGPAFHARWNLGRTKWTVAANAGAGLLHNKLSKMKHSVIYSLPSNELSNLENFPQKRRYSHGDLTGNTVGVSMSAGIRYRIIPLIGIGVQANGLFASLSKMKYHDDMTGKNETIDVSRKINRAGVSAGIDFTF